MTGVQTCALPICVDIDPKLAVARLILDCTKAVEAICVFAVPLGAVGTVGTPVKLGLTAVIDPEKLAVVPVIAPAPRPVSPVILPPDIKTFDELKLLATPLWLTVLPCKFPIKLVAVTLDPTTLPVKLPVKKLAETLVPVKLPVTLPVKFPITLLLNAVFVI
mgnify:CR=1 FL=1